MTQATPYRSTPIFTNDTLPAALRRAHCTKANVWGVLRVIKGSLLYGIEETGDQQIIHAPQSVIIQPQQLHFVEPQAEMEMQIDFYNQAPFQ